MRRVLKVFIIVCSLFVLSACESNDNNAARLELYILRHVKGTHNFIIDEKPIFTGEDILNYEWDTHTITFKDELISSREINEKEDDLFMGGSKILGIYYPDQFALYLDGQELYRGYMRPQMHVSFMPMGPTISNSENGIMISCLDQNEDTRNNDSLHEMLKNSGLLR
ncbi:hypothetical protein [Vallitalea okinawensis]|uniref:hypothetical protein n=1 Tax=Vallitalea okinawensis TaxID=2078660 RepID=UPI000CFDAF5B|nr:hypothetical protein [Vallitalea okinawensis]